VECAHALEVEFQLGEGFAGVGVGAAGGFVGGDAGEGSRFRGWGLVGFGGGDGAGGAGGGAGVGEIGGGFDAAGVWFCWRGRLLGGGGTAGGGAFVV